MNTYRGKTIEHWKNNAEEDYLTTPISVLKYITVLEEQVKQIEKKQMVDFLKWTEGVYSFGNVNGLWYCHINTNLEYTTEELYIKYYNETFKTK